MATKAKAVFNEVPTTRAADAPADFGAFSQVCDADIVGARRAEERVFAEIERLGLRRHAWELETKGWTVIEPELVGPPEFARKLRDKVIEVNERVHGISADLDKGLSDPTRLMSFGEGVSVEGILYEDPMFEKAIVNEAALALITYLLGESCLISSVGGIIKNQGTQHMEMHVDAVGMPSPLPSVPVVANATWVLTDYSREKGATCFVDGSHHRCRPPTPAEAVDLSLFKPVDASAGSILVWGANTWHGAVPRSAPGLRVGLLCFYSRWYMYKGEADPSQRITPEMLARNGTRFRRLSGVDGLSLHPDGSDTPTRGRVAASRFA
jgi:Phytanoyl-CoA dioxygenase (PhyH)